VIDLSARATEGELLDQGVSESEALRSLGDLRFVNRWLFGRGSLLRALAPFLTADARLLDVGCGSADLSAFVLKVGGGRILAIGMDIKLLHVKQAPPGVRRVVADVRALPFGPRSFDVVTASLFLHHFDAPEVSRVLSDLYALARRALVVHDLRRARIPYLFARAFFPFLLRSPVSRSDGLVSIRRAFTRAELEDAFARAGIPGVRIQGIFPYRFLAVAERPA
jgi:SAM-dependent methyltransferase